MFRMQESRRDVFMPALWKVRKDFRRWCLCQYKVVSTSGSGSRRRMTGQITLKEYLESRHKIFPTCGDCVCRNCLYWWSKRCPYGKCWDDYRAETDPYDAAHPEQPPRKWWSNWNKPGEQAHWCRGGNSYPVSYCPHFVKYEGQDIKDCLCAPVSVYQDGYIQCSIVDSIGCQECYRRFLERMERE